MKQSSQSKDASISSLFTALLDYVAKPNQSSEDASLLENSVAAAKAFFERQTLGGLALISPHDYLEDMFAVVGKKTELSVSIGKAQALAGMQAQILVNGNAQKKTPIGPAGKARISYKPQEKGCFPLGVKLFSKTGAQLKDPRNQKGYLLQVFDQSPVVCVDASLLRTQLTKTKKQLLKLSEQGFDFVYLDFDYKQDVDDIRKIRFRSDLPLGAVLPLSTRLEKVESFDVDFKQTFIGMALNRLRSKGVSVVALLSDFKPDEHYFFPEIDILPTEKKLTEKKVASLKKQSNIFNKQYSSHFDEGKSELEWRIFTQVSGEWRDNNSCVADFNNKSSREDIFNEIENAKSQVDLQFYIFKDSRFTHELGVHLAKAAERGVQVRLMVDALWSGENFLGKWNSLLKRMAKTKGIYIVGADALALSDEWAALSLRQRDHRKLILIDQQIAYVGGRNAADEYYYDWSEVPIAEWTLAEAIPWLDVHARLQGPAVKDVQKLFDQTWLRNGGKQLSRKRLTKSVANKEGSRVKLVVHEGTHDANGLAVYEALIAGAQKKLVLVNDFPVLDDIAELLIQAVKRGVKVTFLTGNVLARRSDGSFFEGGKHRELFEYVVKSRLGILVEAGVSVYEFETKAFENIASIGGKVRPYVHAKMVTADSRFVSLGSANLDATASYWEREANLLIDDSKLVKSIDRKLHSFCKQGYQMDISSKEWRRELAQREIVARLWPDGF